MQTNPTHPRTQEREIDRLEQDPNGAVALEALSLERDRLRWLVKTYLRTRLVKVQQYAGECSEGERRGLSGGAVQRTPTAGRGALGCARARLAGQDAFRPECAPNARPMHHRQSTTAPCAPQP